MAATYSAPPIFRVLAKLFPLRDQPEFAQQSLDELKQKYGKWDRYCSLAFLVIAPICVYMLHEAFVAYTSYHAPGLAHAVHTVLPASPFWYAPATILGSIVACFLVYFLYRSLLGERSREYQYYSNRSAGFNASRMFLAAGLMLGGMFLGLTIFAAQSSLQWPDNRIVMRRLWSRQPEQYLYAQVKALKEVYRPEKENPDFVIELNEAPRWSTAMEIVFPGPVEKRFLSERTGKAIEKVMEK